MKELELATTNTDPPHSDVRVCTRLVSDLVTHVVNPLLVSATSLRRHGKKRTTAFFLVSSSRLIFGCIRVTEGALLVGPPGVGKTFSLRAVQTVCRHKCEVSLNIRNNAHCTSRT